MKNADIQAEVYGRVKHFFSIYKKMVNQDKTVDQVYDLFAVRIIVDTVKDCYAAVSYTHLDVYKRQVLKVTSLLDREATDAEKESIAEERKEKQYKDLCEEWKKDVKIEVNEKVWDKISFEKKGIKMKQQEEIPYAEGSDTDKSDQE